VDFSVSLGQEHKPALSASPCGANRDNDSLLFVQPHHPAKECSYAFKHSVSSIFCINLLLRGSWVSCRTSRLWISLLLAPVTAKA